MGGAALATYEPYRPLVDQLYRLLPREEAVGEFERRLRHNDQRIAELAKVLAPLGIRLDFSTISLVVVEEWYLSEVTADGSRPDRLLNLWYEIASDLGVYVGETLIRQADRYRWSLCVDPDSRYYQRTVVSCVVDAAGNLWEWDPGQTVADLGRQRAIDGKRLRTPFVEGMVEQLTEFRPPQA